MDLIYISTCYKLYDLNSSLVVLCLLLMRGSSSNCFDIDRDGTPLLLMIDDGFLITLYPFDCEECM